MPAEYELPHWNPDLPAQPRIRLSVEQEIDQLEIRVHEEPDPKRTYGRTIILETRDDATLALLVYGIDCDEPFTFLLPASGKPLMFLEP